VRFLCRNALRKWDPVDPLEVRWIGGAADVMEDLDADRQVTVVDGSGSKIEMSSADHNRRNLRALP
jgi:hypothetical protein